MATDPRDALDTHGTLYDGAGARGGAGRTVHIDADCHALRDDHDEITEPAQIPLRARVCQKCDPDNEIDYTAGNNPRDDVPAIEDDDGLRPDGGQTQLAVGDTRPDAVPDVKIGTIVSAVMCAHGCDAPAGEGWYTHDVGDVVEEWILENAEATVARLLAADADVQQHSTRTEHDLQGDRLDRFRDSDETEQATLLTDGAGETIAVSLLTGVVYAVTAHEPAGDDGKILAEESRPLTRAEIGARLGEVHGPARRCYREHLGGDGR